MVKLKGGAEKRVTQGQNMAKSGEGGICQVVPPLGSVQKIKTNPKTPPAWQGSWENLKEESETLLKCLHLASISPKVREVPEVPAFACIFPTERKFRTIVARALARQSTKTPHFKCKL